MFAERATATKTFARSQLMIKTSQDSFTLFAMRLQFNLLFPLCAIWIGNYLKYENLMSPFASQVFFCRASSDRCSIRASFPATEIKFCLLSTWVNRFLMLATSWNGYESGAERNYFHLHINMRPSKLNFLKPTCNSLSKALNTQPHWARPIVDI